MRTQQSEQVVALKHKFYEEVQTVLAHTREIRDFLAATVREHNPHPCNFCPKNDPPKRD